MASLACSTCLCAVYFHPFDRKLCAECQVAYQMQEVSDPARRAVNPAPKWAVPIELIEWQAAYTQEVWLCCLPCTYAAEQFRKPRPVARLLMPPTAVLRCVQALSTPLDMCVTYESAAAAESSLHSVASSQVLPCNHCLTKSYSTGCKGLASTWMPAHHSMSPAKLLCPFPG